MDKTVIAGIFVRVLTAGIGAQLVKYGLTAEQSTAFIESASLVLAGVVVTVGTMAWAYVSNRKALNTPAPDDRTGGGQ